MKKFKLWFNIILSIVGIICLTVGIILSIYKVGLIPATVLVSIGIVAFVIFATVNW